MFRECAEGKKGSKAKMRKVWVWDLLKIGHLGGKRSDSGEREWPEKARLMLTEVREGA